MDFLEEAHSGPFFLDVGFVETHRKGTGFGAAPNGEVRTDPRYVRPSAPFPDTPETRQDMADYIDAARMLDAKMGKVLRALERCGLAEGTLVICTTDHGIAFPSMKCNLTDHGMGVMLIMRGPGGFEGGKVTDALVSQIDLFPTLCELADIDPPAWLQGHSLMPLLRNERDEIREEVFSEVNFHATYEPKRAVRTRRWKYIRRFGRFSTRPMPNCDDGPTKTAWVAAGWRERPLAEEYLFDLVFDPGETCNLAGDERHYSVLTEMRARLDRWMLETEDPLLHGPVQPPETGVVNHPQDLSPSGGRQHPAGAFLE